MRTIVNKEIEFPNVKVVWEKDKITEASQISDKTSYFKLFKLAAEQAPNDGWNKAGVGELRKRLDLIDKIASSEERFVLEEDQYENLKKCVESLAIHSTSRAALDFTEYLDGIKKEEVEVKA